METNSKCIALSATSQPQNGYTHITVWKLRDIRDDAVKTVLPSGAVTVENSGYVRYEGKRYRVWDYKKPTENQPWGKTRTVYVRDYPGVMGVMAVTPKTEEGFRQLMEQVARRQTKGKDDATRNLYLTTGLGRGTKIHQAKVEWTTLHRMKLGYYGITETPATLSLQWGYSPSYVVRRTEVRFSPVRTETETLPCGLHWDTVPRLDRGMRTPGITVVYKFADGTPSQALTEIAEGGDWGADAWREDKDKWVNQCREEWVLTKVTGLLRRGEYVVDHEMGALRETRPDLSVVGLSALSTKADRVPTGSVELERIVAQRRELKEALAMAVFAPERVDRMTQTYGEDWMERV
jgi:hypothetical protein